MEQTKAAQDVLAERERQKAVEGWTPEHDDEHKDGELACAAACYADEASLQAVSPLDAHPSKTPLRWPWANMWWKPKSQRRNLIKAAALILAEIERLDRAEAVAPNQGKGE